MAIVTVQDLKREHPDLYKQVYDSGYNEGIQEVKNLTRANMGMMATGKEQIVNNVKVAHSGTPEDIAIENIVEAANKARKR